MKPVILLTPQYEDGSENVSVRLAYTRAVAAAGGIPLTLSYEQGIKALELLHLASGLLLTGGDDVDPSLYKEKTSAKCKNISRLRDDFEIKLIKRAIETGLPTLGICRGVQIMNVALGGSLYQDIPSHMQSAEKSKPSHGVLFTPSPISDIYPRHAQVNSFHHQSVKALGEELETFARADDGVIEGIYRRKSRFFVGVQWHPEHMTDNSASELFLRFVRMAREYKKTRR